MKAIVGLVLGLGMIVCFVAAVRHCFAGNWGKAAGYLLSAFGCLLVAGILLQ